MKPWSLHRPPCFLKKFADFQSDERRTYAAMVASLDESVGKISTALKTKGMFENSVIVFTTDNGGAPAGFDWFVNVKCSTFHFFDVLWNSLSWTWTKTCSSFWRSQGCNYPFKGGKDTLWEGGIRGVAFVHSTLIPNKGRVSYDLIDASDWLPTLYYLAGGDVKRIQYKIDGINVWDTIAHGVQSPRKEVVNKKLNKQKK